MEAPQPQVTDETAVKPLVLGSVPRLADALARMGLCADSPGIR